MKHRAFNKLVDNNEEVKTYRAVFLIFAINSNGKIKSVNTKTENATQ